jgi:DNA-binding response OmpR family regulator
VTGSVLLIDTDAAIITELVTALWREGYPVHNAMPGVDAFRALLIDPPDLVILGLESCDRDWGFCRRLITWLDQPLLLLLSTDNTHDRVKGLELGADDCMIKPVLAAEVVARTRALLRRDAHQSQRNRRSFFVDEGFVIDMANHEVRLEGRPVMLTPTEFRVLSCLAEQAGQVISSRRLADRVWGQEVDGRREMVKVYVHRLRRKLEPDPRKPQRLLTRRGTGYLLRRLGQP